MIGLHFENKRSRNRFEKEIRQEFKRGEGGKVSNLKKQSFLVRRLSIVFVFSSNQSSEATR
jgi:hypothetical protein